MSVRVRLTRVGSKKNPIWRVVVTDQRSPRDGRFIEQIGHYNPRTEPSTIAIDRERLDHWIELGAQPTNTVKKLMRAKPPEPGAEAPPEPTGDEGEPEPAADDAESGTGSTEPDEGAEGDADADAGDGGAGAEGEGSGDAEATEPAEAS